MSNVQNILNTASQYLGTQDYRNFCEAFVEQVTQGKTGMYPSAIQAWVAQQGNAVQGTQGIQPGDTVYFSANKGNGGYGHTGIYIGNGQFISATYNGVKTEDLGKWQASTGQQLLGYVPSGAQGRGVVQSAQNTGQQLNSQMNQAGNSDPQQMQQLLQQFQTQQHIRQSEQVIQNQRDQAQAQLQQGSQFQQPSTPVPPTPSLSPTSPASSPSLPYGNLLTPKIPSPTQPINPPGINANPGGPTLPNSTSTDLSKPQINLNPAQSQ